MKCQIGELRCISRKVFRFQTHSCIFWLMNDTANRSSKLCFHFFFNTAHCVSQLERKLKGKTAFSFSCPTPQKCSIYQFEFTIPSGAGKWHQWQLFLCYSSAQYAQAGVAGVPFIYISQFINRYWKMKNGCWFYYHFKQKWKNGQSIFVKPKV